jgi:hypothetical protein
VLASFVKSTVKCESAMCKAPVSKTTMRESAISKTAVSEPAMCEAVVPEAPVMLPPKPVAMAAPVMSKLMVATPPVVPMMGEAESATMPFPAMTSTMMSPAASAMASMATVVHPTVLAVMAPPVMLACMGIFAASMSSVMSAVAMVSALFTPVCLIFAAPGPFVTAATVRPFPTFVARHLLSAFAAPAVLGTRMASMLSGLAKFISVLFAAASRFATAVTVTPFAIFATRHSFSVFALPAVLCTVAASTLSGFGKFHPIAVAEPFTTRPGSLVSLLGSTTVVAAFPVVSPIGIVASVATIVCHFISPDLVALWQPPV